MCEFKGGGDCFGNCVFVGGGGIIYCDGKVYLLLCFKCVLRLFINFLKIGNDVVIGDLLLMFIGFLVVIFIIMNDMVIWWFRWFLMVMLFGILLKL